jgi:hypothetical protein
LLAFDRLPTDLPLRDLDLRLLGDGTSHHRTSIARK